jgi:hypothetical protein
MTLIPEALDRLQEHVYMTLCLMEKIFPLASSLAWSTLSSILYVNVNWVDRYNTGGYTLERDKTYLIHSKIIYFICGKVQQLIEC